MMADDDEQPGHHQQQLGLKGETEGGARSTLSNNNADDDERHDNTEDGNADVAQEEDDHDDEDDDGEASKSLASGCSSTSVSDDNVDVGVENGDGDDGDEEEENDDDNDIDVDVDADAGKDQPDFDSTSRRRRRRPPSAAAAEISSTSTFIIGQPTRRQHNHQVPHWMKLSFEKNDTAKNGLASLAARVIVRVDKDDDETDLHRSDKDIVKRRFCLVGRSEIEIRHGRVEILGTVLDATTSTSGSGSMTKTSICSPYWSSWMTVEIDTSCLPCELVLSSIHRRRPRRRHHHRHQSRRNGDESGGGQSDVDGVAAEKQEDDNEEDNIDGNSNKRRKIQVDDDIDSDINTAAEKQPSQDTGREQEHDEEDSHYSTGLTACSSTFRIMFPTRPVVLPPSWRSNVSQVIDDFTGEGHNDHSRLQSPSSHFDDDDDQDQDDNDHKTDNRNICLVTGAKGVGKSTLLRYMTNRLLSSSSPSSSPSSSKRDITEVAILDIDVGQPELAPPGIISLSIVRRPLLRPPYWNLAGTATTTINHGHDDDDGGAGDDQASTMVDRDDDDMSPFETVSSVFFGSTTSKTDPTRYLKGISYLMAQYESTFCRGSSSTNRLPPPPLLVNCDGWVKGLGYEILVALIQDVVKPTHVCQIVGQSRAQTFDLSSLVQADANEVKDDNQYQPYEDQHQSNGPKRVQPTLHILEACTSMPDASLCTVPSYTLRNFRWATYFLPSLTGVFDTWDTMQAKELQTGWIVAKQSAFESNQIKDMHRQYRYYGPSNDTVDDPRGVDDDGENDYDDNGDECILAQTLASERPYAVPFEAVDCRLVGSEFHNANHHDDEQQKYRVIQVMNGNIVGLCTDASSMECIGLGIVRSVDWSKQILYLIVPDSVSSRFSLSDVKVLVGGHLTLPMPLLFRGVYAESFLFHAVVKKKKETETSTSILGLEPMRSRNNISRRSLTAGKP